MANQYDPLVIKSGLAGVLDTDTLRADLIAHAGLTTTGLTAGDACQVSGNLTLGKAAKTSRPLIFGVYDEVTGSVVREGVVAAGFISGLTIAAGDTAYLSDTAGKLTNVKPTLGAAIKAGVVVDASIYGSPDYFCKLLLQPEWPVGLAVPGQVIVVGGGSSDPGTGATEVYNEDTAQWSLLGQLHTPRINPNIVILPDRRILAIGGRNTGDAALSTTEILVGSYWTTISPLNTARKSACCCVLADGRVLITGGLTGTSTWVYTSEVWDPSTELWSYVASSDRRVCQTEAVLLNNGKVLVSGGFYSTTYHWDARIYDPADDSWIASTNDMSRQRAFFPSIILSDGRVLLAGGYYLSGGTYTPACDTYDPATNSFTATGNLPEGRAQSALVVLADGQVFWAGGYVGGGFSRASAAIWNPSTGLWTATGSMTRTRSGFNLENRLAAFRLSNGNVLIPNNLNGVSSYSAYDIFNGSTCSSPGGSLVSRQSRPAAGVWFPPA